MSNITLTKVASTYKDNYQKYNIPIMNKDFLDISLEHVKKDILATLINISNSFNRFKANIMLEIDFKTLSSEPLEIKYDIVDIDDIDKLVINILQKYKDLLEFNYMKSVYLYSAYLIINTCAL